MKLYILFLLLAVVVTVHGGFLQLNANKRAVSSIAVQYTLSVENCPSNAVIWTSESTSGCSFGESNTIEDNVVVFYTCNANTLQLYNAYRKTRRGNPDLDKPVTSYVISGYLYGQILTQTKVALGYTKTSCSSNYCNGQTFLSGCNTIFSGADTCNQNYDIFVNQSPNLCKSTNDNTGECCSTIPTCTAPTVIPSPTGSLLIGISGNGEVLNSVYQNGILLTKPTPATCTGGSGNCYTYPGTFSVGDVIAVSATVPTEGGETTEPATIIATITTTTSLTSTTDKNWWGYSTGINGDTTTPPPDSNGNLWFSPNYNPFFIPTWIPVSVQTGCSATHSNNLFLTPLTTDAGFTTSKNIWALPQAVSGTGENCFMQTQNSIAYFRYVIQSC
jgi:hypothetical protein